MRKINPEPIIQSEVSQKEKDKYCTLMHIYGIQKDSIDDPIYRAGQETQTLLFVSKEQTSGHREGQGEMI